MLKVLKKNWLHIAIWSLMFIYLLVAPGVYARYMVKGGKPVQFIQELPAVTDNIKYSIDRLDVMSSDGQELYNLWGWAFFLGDNDQSIYDRYLVLQSEKNRYFFLLESLQRPDLQLAFANINMDIRNTGFSTFISKDIIRPGEYKIGIVFQHRTSAAIHYATTDKILIRTPNTFSLGNAQSSESSTQPGNISGQKLPIMTDKIRYSVDRLDLITSNNQSLYNLWGWAFLLDSADQTQYVRYIIFQSKSVTLSYLTQSFERPGVQQAFPSANMDLLNTGFSITFSEEDIPDGTYEIGILFDDQQNDNQYFTITNKLLVHSADQLQLVIADQKP